MQPPVFNNFSLHMITWRYVNLFAQIPYCFMCCRILEFLANNRYCFKSKLSLLRISSQPVRMCPCLAGYVAEKNPGSAAACTGFAFAQVDSAICSLVLSLSAAQRQRLSQGRKGKAHLPDVMVIFLSSETVYFRTPRIWIFTNICA